MGSRYYLKHLLKILYQAGLSLMSFYNTTNSLLYIYEAYNFKMC